MNEVAAGSNLVPFDPRIDGQAATIKAEDTPGRVDLSDNPQAPVDLGFDPGESRRPA